MSAIVLAGILLLGGQGQRTPDDYRLGPDSVYHEGVPRGEVTKYSWTSKVFPGTVRDYWVYVPRQYDPAKTACVMVFQDGGGGLHVPEVFDNLINRHEMPVTIAIMINPGVVPAKSDMALPRYNRSYEYDAPTDQYVRFLLEEILPEVGRKYSLTKDATGRAICGLSSGGIAAFTAAWERPDAFSRVVSGVGSFTNLRGGHIYPSLIRKHEPKPIRVFMQEGSNDQDIYSGSWPIGNTDVAAALKFAGCDVRFEMGDGYHSGKHLAAIFPDACRWIWRDYPTPILAPKSTAQPVMQVIDPAEPWQPVAPEYKSVTAIAAEPNGNIEFADSDSKQVLSIAGAGAQATSLQDSAAYVADLKVDSTGRVIAGQPERMRIVTLSAAGRSKEICRGIAADHIAVNSKGDIYAAAHHAGRIWVIEKNGKPREVDAGTFGITGLIFTPDESLLIATTKSDKLAYSFHVQSDGSLIDKQPYFDIDIPYGRTETGASGMAVDTEGRLYVASAAGIQIMDQAGRVIGILSNPERTPTTALAFGGSDHKELYAVAGGRIYRRKTKVTGVLPGIPPLKPPAPRL